MTLRGVNIIARIVTVVALVFAIGFAWWTHDDDAPPPRSSSSSSSQPTAHRVPIDLFASAHPGDWYAYQVVNGGPVGEIRTTAMVWIAAERPDGVTRAARGRIDASGEERAIRSEDFPRAGLTLERLIGADRGGWTLTDVAVTDEIRVVGGRSFPCKRLSFGSTDPMFPRKRTHTDLWISRDVPAGGLVAEREEQHLDDQTFVITQELIGFGTASETSWGTRPAGW
jgi:hypothetical protein